MKRITIELKNHSLIAEFASLEVIEEGDVIRIVDDVMEILRTSRALRIHISITNHQSTNLLKI